MKNCLPRTLVALWIMTLGKACTTSNGGGTDEASCFEPPCDPAPMSCFQPPCEGPSAGAGGATPPEDPIDAAVQEPTLPQGAVVERLGLVIVGGELSEDPVPTPTTSGLEPDIISIALEAVDDVQLNLVLEVDTLYPATRVHLQIDDAYIVLPIVVAPQGGALSVVPGFTYFSPDSDRGDLSGCSADPPGGADSPTQEHGCYPSCLEACRSDECLDAGVINQEREWQQMECARTCSQLVGYLDYCTRRSECDQEWRVHIDALLERYGSYDGFVASMDADRLDGWLCDYYDSQVDAWTSYEWHSHLLAPMATLCHRESDPIIDSSPDDGVMAGPDVYGYWACRIEGESAAEREKRRERISVALFSNDWAKVGAGLGLAPMVAVESHLPASAPAVSQLARGELSTCMPPNNDYFVDPCKGLQRK